MREIQRKRNYQKELDAILSALKEKEGESGGQKAKPGLLLHSCCAPCSSYCLKYLADYFAITDLYYNPNITEKEEYEKRAEELKRLIKAYDRGIIYREAEYEPELFFETVKGLENEPEGSRRCYLCYELRLRKAAQIAAEGNFEYFTTTLSISPLKNADWINEIGERLAEEYGVKHLPSDFKKRDGYRQSIGLSREYGLYRQDYCGCVFSKRERHNKSEEI